MLNALYHTGIMRHFLFSPNINLLKSDGSHMSI